MREAVAAAGAGCVVNLLLMFELLRVDALCVEHGCQLLESDNEVYIAAHGAAGGLQLLRSAGSHEYHFCVRMFLLDRAGRRHHGRQRAGYLVRHIREVELRQHGPGRAARSQQERQVSIHNFLNIVMRFRYRTHICAEGYLIDLREAQLHQRCLDLLRSGVAKLTDVGWSNFRDDLAAFLECADQLEDL